MIDITPIQVPTKGTAVKLWVTIQNLTLVPTNGVMARYNLLDENTQILISGNLEIPKSIYDQWGTDDTYMVDYILGELNLSKLSQ